MDGVSHQDLGFAVGIADADIDGLGVEIAVLGGYGFVGGFVAVCISGCLI